MEADEPAVETRPEGAGTGLAHRKPETRASKIGFYLATLFMCMVATAMWLLAYYLGRRFITWQDTLPYVSNDAQSKFRLDSVLGAAHTGMLGLHPPAVQLQNSVGLSRSGLYGGERLTLEVIYESKVGNIFSLQLQDIMDLENKITAESAYGDLCLRDWPASNLTAASLFSAPDATILDMNKALPSCKAPLSALMACATGAASSCGASDTSATPPGLLTCLLNTTCTPATAKLDGDFAMGRLTAYASADPLSSPAVAQFHSYTDTAFGAGNPVSSTLRTTFQFGLPLPGYASAVDRTGEQEDKVWAFVMDTVAPLLEDAAGDQMDVWYSCGGHACEQRLLAQMPLHDIAPVAAAVAFMGLFVMYTQWSLYLGFAVALQITVAFAGGYIISWLVGEAYFGPYVVPVAYICMQFMTAAFLLFMNVYRVAGLISPAITVDLKLRLKLAMRSTSRSITATALAAGSSFICPLLYAPPGLISVGIFAALTVLVALLTTIVYSYFVVAYYHARTQDVMERDHTICCGLIQSRESALAERERRLAAQHAEEGSTAAGKADPNEEVEVPVEGAEREGGKNDTANEAAQVHPAKGDAVMESYRGAEPLDTISEADAPDDIDAAAEASASNEIWFKAVYAPFLETYRVTVILVFLAVLGFLLHTGSAILPARAPLYPFSSGNFPGFNAARRQYHTGLDSSRRISARLVWGLDDSTITMDQAISLQNPSLLHDLARFKLDANARMSVGAPCALALCSEVETFDADLGLGGMGASCMLRAFNQWVVANAGSADQCGGVIATWSSMTGCPTGCVCSRSIESNTDTCQAAIRAQETKWWSAMYTFLRVPGMEDAYGSYIVTGAAAPAATCTVTVNALGFRYTYIEVPLAVNGDVPARTGMELEKQWDDWLAAQYQQGAPAGVCADVGGMWAGFHYAVLPDGWLWDYAGAWDWFKAQDDIRMRLWPVVLLSCGAVLLFTTLATGNVLMWFPVALSLGLNQAWVVAFAVLTGQHTGPVSAVMFVLTPGITATFTVFLATGYSACTLPGRAARVEAMLMQSGGAVVQAGVGVALATTFMQFCEHAVFRQFGSFFFITVIGALVSSVGFFAALCSLLGPSNNIGSIAAACRGRSAAVAPEAVSYGPEGGEEGVEQTPLEGKPAGADFSSPRQVWMDDGPAAGNGGGTRGEARLLPEDGGGAQRRDDDDY